MKMWTVILSVLIMISMSFGLVACGGSSNERPSNGTGTPVKADAPAQQLAKSEKATGIKIKVTAGQQVLTATLIDNATSRDLIAKLPLTVPMKNLYAREMVYRFPDPLPAQEAQQSGYEVGDLSYWAPGHSLVIFYEQNGEVISNLQKIGRFDSSLDFFRPIEAIDVKFELQ